MNQQYTVDKKFEKIDFTERNLMQGDFENCGFYNCNFSSSSVSGISFTDCEFINCNLSLIKVIKTTFNDIKFVDCKITGVHFEDCSDFTFSVNFEKCILNFSSFYKSNLSKTIFSKCEIREVDFTEANLTGATFKECDLMLTTFDNSILHQADFRTAINYSIDPLRNKLKKAMFSLPGLPGLLDKFDIIIE